MMNHPYPAEWARTVIERAGDAVVSALSVPTQRVLRLAVDDEGALLLCVGQNHPLALVAPVQQWPKGRVAVPDPGPADPVTPPTVLVEIVDLTPAAVADRVRTRVVVIGTMTRLLGTRAALARTLLRADEGTDPTHDVGSEPAALLVTPQAIAVGDPNRRGSVALAASELAAAVPDPVSPCEEVLLTFLAQAYRPGLQALGRRLLAENRDGTPVPRQRGRVVIDPVGLDRFGLTLRLGDGAEGHRDIRIAFETPVRSPAAAAQAAISLLRSPAWAAHMASQS